MKRYLGAVVLVSMVMCWTVPAEATSLSIVPDPIIASSGTNVLMSVDYTAKKAQVASLQFDLLYDPSVLRITTVTAGSGVINASKTLGDNLISPGEHRVIISGFNQSVFGDGVVAHITVQVSNGAPAGPYSLFLCNIVASDPNGRSVPIKVKGETNREKHKEKDKEKDKGKDRGKHKEKHRDPGERCDP